MRIVEIRDLDGPNLFLMSPAIKVEIGDIPEGEQDEVIASLRDMITGLHVAIGLDAPTLSSTTMETPGHIVVAFEWTRRSLARSLGGWAAQLVIGERSDLDQVITELREILDREPEEDDAPLLIKDADDRVPIVSVTGTNGKTTTSRLITFVLKHAGFKVGLTSSAGVFIDGEQIVEGDYSGPSGARHVLADSSVEFAVLETARGGLLLRGCGYEASDVALITNVSEDHLGLHGIHSIEGLAAVKAIVARNVTPGGFCILNAGDEHVLAMREVTPGVPVLFSPNFDSDAMRTHIDSGGLAISVDDDGNVVWFQDGESRIVTTLADIPMTFNGKASHQVENALAGIAALIGLGLPDDQIREGVANFKSTAANSKGRLNIFKVNDATVIIDFAHNEAGLTHLLNFARNFVEGDGRLISVIGTAGDRDNHSLRAIAQRAVRDADVVVLKDSVHYLRGREAGEMIAEMHAAIQELDGPGAEVRDAPDERTATFMMVDELRPHDVLAVMCVEDYSFILEKLSNIGEEVA